MLWIDLPLCGRVAAWRFPGSPGLSQWLDALPWLAEGGICSVLCATESEYPVIEAAIEREAHAAQVGAGNLRIIQVQSDSRVDSPLAACLAAFDLDPMARLRVAEALAQALRTEPTLFILRLVGIVDIDEWEKLSDFADIYRKRYLSSPLTVVVLNTASLVNLRPQFDFRQGWPEGIDLWSDGLEVRERWAGYRYLRIAWEAAGSLTVAEDLEQRTRDLTLGSDEVLEKHFNDHAQGRLKTFDISAPSWKNLTTAYGYHHPRPKPDEFVNQPTLWWKPPHSIGLRLAPWACRAALLQKSEPGLADWKLRNELICEPLADELFALCQQGEALIRTRIFRSGLKQPPSNEASQLWERFRADNNGNSNYPVSHPAPPGDAWSFASLGEVIKAASQRLPDPFWDLLLLRNSVGHGHFVGWKQITTLIDFMRVVQ